MSSGSVKWCLRQLFTDRVIDIDSSENSMVGRKLDAKICLKSNKSSRTHAAFVVNVEGNLLLQDLKSINGTFVNGTQISVYILHRVFPEDVISFGLADINMAEDDRDRQCFFKVLLVEQLPMKESSLEGVLADSTTEIRENSACRSIRNQTKNTTNELIPDSILLDSKSDQNQEYIDMIQISSSISDNEVDNLSAIRIENVFSVAEDESSSKRTTNLKPNAKLPKEPAKQKVQPLNCSLGSFKETKRLPSNNSKRRRTIQVEVNDSGEHKESNVVKPIKSRKSGPCKKNVSAKISEPNNVKKLPKKATSDCDFGELILQSSNVILGSNEKMSDKSEPNSDHLTKLNNRQYKNQPSAVATSNKIHLSEKIYEKSEAERMLEKKINEPLISNRSLPGNRKTDDEVKTSDIKRLENEKYLNGMKNDKVLRVNALSNNFTTDKDNSVIIDITDDDDDMDFSCSQIFHMSQVVRTEGQDDKYQKIKSELAEMDFCNEEIVLNPVPINLENDFDTTGFENTQEICAFLQDGIEVDNNATISVIDQPSNSIELNPIDCEIAEFELLTNKTPTSSVVRYQDENLHKIEPTSKSGSSVEKRKSSKPPIIEPHTITKPAKKILRKKPDEINKVNEGITCKRKSSIETPINKKKTRANSKSPMNPLKYDSKDIASEFQKRRRSSVELNKAEKVSIKEERRKKLKELASGSTYKSHQESSHSDLDKFPDDSGIKELRIDSASTTRNNAHLDPRKNAVTDKAMKERKVIAENVEYGTLKLVDLPPSCLNYNLRRAKSSDDMKVRKSNTIPDELSNRPITRYSTSTDVRAQSVSAKDCNLGAEVIPRAKCDPRTAALARKPCSKKPHTDSVHPQGKSLIWSNGALARKPAVRRLVNVDDITKKIVEWLPNWLEEQVYTDCSPPVNSPPATKIPLHFQDFNQYYNTFSKLVLLENWQYLYKGFQESSEQPRKVKIEHVRVANDLMTLDCVCYITRQELKQGHFYKPEDVVLFECVINDKNNCYMSLNFGLIQSCRKSVIPNDGLISVKRDLCEGNPHTILEFTVITRYQPNKEINTRRNPIIKLLANIRGHLMLIRAIKGLEKSPLCSMILSPKMLDYKFTVTHQNIIHPYNLSPLQKDVVLEAASLCTGDKHGIYCVKGPPGTGKSTIIVNLIFQILFSHRFRKKPGKPPMILLAAPSNTAVDSLISKLVNIKYSLKPELRHQIKLVRIGPESSISKEVIGYSLPKLAENHVAIKNIDMPQIKAAKERNENLLEFTKALLGDKYIHELKICENIIIDKSNIICTTLNSCINGLLMDAVNRGLIEFTCCIIDEATQCHEVEALLPTILGINKLVLVGDPQQLNATVLSRDAVKLGFGESLFTRLANNFRNDPRSPIKMLTEQYRMHPEICAFPNKQFYEGKLKSFPKHVNKLPDEIQPYIVFNCEKITPSKDYTNMDEIYVIQKLLTTIFNMVNKNYKYTVGIITPYNAQKHLICSNIADLSAENQNCKITTNTVDSFQGSEFDIVIISCVRDSSNSFLQNENRLNVALTRAKQALYIIGNYTLFKECRPLYDLREDAKKRKVLLDIKQNPRTIGDFNKYLIRRPRSSSTETPIIIL